MTLDELPSARALSGESTPPIELCIVRPDGQRVPVTKHTSPVRDPSGGLIGAIVVLRDITVEKELERLREEFAVMVVHDLRNAIEPILLQLNLLEKLVENGKMPTLTALHRLARSGARLSLMVSDLLESACVELSRVPLDRLILNVGDTVKDILDSIRPMLGEHKVVFEVRGRPPAALLDLTRVGEIVTNLLTNAAKYSADGTTIRVAVEAASGGVEISVQDQGMGIAPEDVPKLFDRFYQTKRARERKTGFGLGLYITKGLVEAHGGHISVESRPDRGSTFRVWFPVGPPVDDTASHSSVQACE